MARSGVRSESAWPHPVDSWTNIDLKQGVEVALHRLRQRGSRAVLARVPERPPAHLMIRPQVEMARGAGVAVDELDAHHVLLPDDARDRDQWLAVDEVYDAAYPR